MLFRPLHCPRTPSPSHWRRAPTSWWPFTTADLAPRSLTWSVGCPLDSFHLSNRSVEDASQSRSYFRTFSVANFAGLGTVQCRCALSLRLLAPHQSENSDIFGYPVCPRSGLCWVENEHVQRF